MEIDFYIPDEKFFGQDIKAYVPEISHQHVVINGFPYDEGTKRNSGRIGGSAATHMFRKSLNSHEIYKKQGIDIYDSGDITQDLALEEAHQNLYSKNIEILKNPQTILCVFGGSNDQSFPNAQSLIDTYPNSKIAVINIDAHFDVRPLKEGKAHSGSPFRQLLEYGKFIQNKSIFVEFASKGASCSEVHYKYLQDHGCQVIWLEKNIRRFKTVENSEYRTQGGQMMKNLLDRLSTEVEYIFVSFDIDSISSQYMPGVSAPSIVGGLTNIEACQIMEIAGKNSKVKLLDFSEFNPAVESFRSGKLLVEIFYSFCMATIKREQKP